MCNASEFQRVVPVLHRAVPRRPRGAVVRRRPSDGSGHPAGHVLLLRPPPQGHVEDGHDVLLGLPPRPRRGADGVDPLRDVSGVLPGRVRDIARASGAGRLFRRVFRGIVARPRPGIGAGGQEARDSSRVAAPGGDVQRRPAHLVPGAQARPALDEAADDPGVAVERGQVEGRGASPVSRGEVRPHADEPVQPLRVGERRGVQELLVPLHLVDGEVAAQDAVRERIAAPVAARREAEDLRGVGLELSALRAGDVVAGRGVVAPTAARNYQAAGVVVRVIPTVIAHHTVSFHRVVAEAGLVDADTFDVAGVAERAGDIVELAEVL
mmetsp:Transcript_14289/g.42614  ORF Transcript_14289/g.42614 Transcript_14289/m.42614 type:complete len:324 (+) Transcript_14289:57-1028(+)